MARVIKKKDKTSIICPKSKRFESIIVCAINCKKRCAEYHDKISLDKLLKFAEEHPAYKIVGEFMAVKTPKTTPKIFWVVTENQFVEVTEEEIKNDPQKYLGKQIWDKPPCRYELVVSLKKIKD